MASNTKAAATAKATEPVYTVAELANNYTAFNTRREIVVTALRMAGKESMTFAEAKAIVEKFKTKEVK